MWPFILHADEGGGRQGNAVEIVGGESVFLDDPLWVAPSKESWDVSFKTKHDNKIARKTCSENSLALEKDAINRFKKDFT